MPELILYHAPPSFYSQIARIVLAEKSVLYDSYIAIAGPPVFETYKPWYLKLNPNGTIPTLVHNGNSIKDSFEIAYYVDQNFEGPSLTPQDDASKQDMEHWISILKSIEIRNLTYGSVRLRKIGGLVNGMRIKSLESHKKTNIGLNDVYKAKIKDIDDFMNRSLDKEHVTKVRKKVLIILDSLNKHLENKQWIVGKDYSLADAFWTVAIGRLCMLKLSPIDERPALTAWYTRMKQRPSFNDADIWGKFKPQRLLFTIAKKFPFPSIIILSMLFGLGFTFWYLS